MIYFVTTESFCSSIDKTGKLRAMAKRGEGSDAGSCSDVLPSNADCVGPPFQAWPD